MADKTPKIADVSTEDIVHEMEVATKGFMEERGKSVPEKKTSARKIVEELQVPPPEEVVEYPQVEEVTETQESADTNGYSEDELLAMEKGWKPKDQYKGDLKDFRSAKEFLGRSELYDKMSNQSKTIKEMQSAMKTLTELNRRQAEMSRRQHEMIHKDRLEYFQQQKKAAVDIASHADVDKYEKAIQDEQKELEMYKPESVHQEESSKHKISESTKAFLDRNSWFDPNPNVHNDMKDYAIFYEQRLMHKNPELTEEQRLVETERMVKKVFSENFENKNRARAPSVNMAPSENVSLKKTVKKKHSFDNLPSDIKQQVRLMAKFSFHNGKNAITLDDYAEQLYETGVMKDE